MVIVVTTHERPDALKETLKALAPQLSPLSSPHSVSVLVVDDGTERGDLNAMVVEEALSDYHYQYVWKPQGGASSARNLAIAMSAGADVLLVIGDDQIPGPGLIKGHLAAHERFAAECRVIVCGFTEWWVGNSVTPFMFWLDHGGPQYRYGKKASGWAGINVFYTSNVSIRRRHALDIGVFDEALFPFDDTDYGLRALSKGFRFWFDRGLVTYHNHPQTIASYCSRMHNMGKQFHHLAEKHPQLRFQYHLRRNNAIVRLFGGWTYRNRLYFERRKWFGLVYWLITRRAFYNGFVSVQRHR